ncbi:TPM domain-containing protein [Helicobacter sp.]|uniref:TPM domain-containing protein n=1 Tax=Helicobacter sp. TaxID=218 RepID=UPI0025C5F292|nr:TPM domain-containing protein [Helicobacter sp.]MCI5967977.1 TPM domain-containing protein [Helicobacter sp.]MDY2585092.1 TPM domain-containing protein [Helicobacter sp.]
MLKILEIGIFSLFFCVFAFARTYVLENQNQLVDKTEGFIEILSDEVYEKTGVSLYVVALENLGGKSIQEQEHFFTQNLKFPYALLFFTQLEKKINIITSPEVERMFDKKEVYWDYIVPLIPQSDKELTQQNISAFLLNGFVDIADRIATYHNVELEHSFPKQNKGVEIAVRTLLYAMLFIMLLLFLFVHLRKK